VTPAAVMRATADAAAAPVTAAEASVRVPADMASAADAMAAMDAIAAAGAAIVAGAFSDAIMAGLVSSPPWPHSFIPPSPPTTAVEE